jgi:hypothetical protein
LDAVDGVGAHAERVEALATDLLDAADPAQIQSLTSELLEAIENSRETALTSALATLEMLGVDLDQDLVRLPSQHLERTDVEFAEEVDPATVHPATLPPQETGSTGVELATGDVNVATEHPASVSEGEHASVHPLTSVSIDSPQEGDDLRVGADTRFGADTHFGSQPRKLSNV